MFDAQFLLLGATVLGIAALGAYVTNRDRRSDATGSNVSRRDSRFPFGDRTIAVTTTSAEKRLALGTQVSWRSGDKQTTGSMIYLDPTRSFQTILGFGAAFTDAACYMFNQLSAPVRDRLFDELFSPTQLGLNVNRVCMGSSDYATKLYSYCDGEADPELKRFSIEHDRQWNLPMMREALAKNPDMFIFASPWSPPGWMKSNGSMLGGNMQRQYMPSHAQYFVRFIQEYAKEGVHVRAVTINNEVDTDQDGRMPACAWPQEYEVDFIRYHLGPAFEKAGIDAKIWMIDHNYNLWGRALASLDEPGLLKYCNAIAWHGYVGDPKRISQVQSSFPQVEMYWTEGGPDVTNADYATDWAKWGKTFTMNLRNHCRAITAWNLALDEKGNPNIGPFPCGGIVTIDSQSKEVSYSGQFWAMAQFSKFVKRGAQCISSVSEEDGELMHVAFKNPDGQYVLVVTNAGDKPRLVTVAVSEQYANVQLDPNSITTLVW